MKSLWIFLCLFFLESYAVSNKIHPVQDFTNPWDGNFSYRSNKFTVVDLAFRTSNIDKLKETVRERCTSPNNLDPAKYKVTDDNGQEWIGLKSTNPTVVKVFLEFGVNPLEQVNFETVFCWQIKYYLWRNAHCHLTELRKTEHLEVLGLLAAKMTKEEKKKELKKAKKGFKVMEGRVAKEQVTKSGALKKLNKQLAAKNPSLLSYFSQMCKDSCMPSEGVLGTLL